MSVTTRLEELKIELPTPSEPRFVYVPCKRTGNLVYTSGQDCRKNGELVHKGKLGSDLTMEEGQEAAEVAVINCLSVIQAEIGSLDHIKQVVKMLAFVNSAPGFSDQPYVINAASTLLEKILGEEKGKHARSAIGTSELPFDTPVEIELIVEVEG
ncbi:RidA family protein [Shouchella shacheensis]|uniref:RidA family protein n=1 Tax=Shouchella shacheensis TaxID=1649580 RepID=UPI0007402F1C|nr:RidA family protein [Shouchella shacheensis]